jgi:hypothetical protein
MKNDDKKGTKLRRKSSEYTLLFKYPITTDTNKAKKSKAWNRKMVFNKTCTALDENLIIFFIHHLGPLLRGRLLDRPLKGLPL